MSKRRVIDQVKSGFKIVAAILFSFAAFLLVGISYVGITQDSPKLSHGSAWALLITMVMLMFLTVRFWAKWFCGITSYLAVRSMLLPLFAGRGSLSDVPIRSAVAITASFWLMAILSIHFYRRHHFSILDQFSITGAAVSLFIGFMRLGSAGNNGIILPVLMGIPLLVLSSYQKRLKHLAHKFSRNPITHGPTRPDFL
jgi:hypothetical protein